MNESSGCGEARSDLCMWIPRGSKSTPRPRTPVEIPSPSKRGDEGRLLRVAVTVLVVAGGIGVASTLHRFDWGTFARAIAHLSPSLLVVALLVSTVQVFAQLARFVVLLPRADRSPLRELLDATAVGQLLNYTTVLRAGDAYKLIRLAPPREPQEPNRPSGANGRFSILLAALLVERVADIVALLVMAAW